MLLIHLQTAGCVITFQDLQPALQVALAPAVSQKRNTLRDFTNRNDAHEKIVIRALFNRPADARIGLRFAQFG